MTHHGDLDLLTLSRRGRRLVEHPPEPEYLREHFARAADAPDHYVPLCIAENALSAVGGVVPVKASAESGPIAPSDSLAGRAPGLAVPAGGHVRAGAVLGAGLTSLDAGTAVVTNPAGMR